jgi:BirA family biotin operon repressor/biotin-[acetyl-CoA-carboxylase] ligase
MRIKWPNDIYHEQAKVAGILIENVIQGTTIQSSIIGMGVNVNQQKFDHRLYNPTSMSLIKGNKIDVETVLDILCEHIECYYLLLRQGHYEQIEQLYLNHLYRFQQTALFAHNGYLLSGSITGVMPDGRLVIHSNGKDRHFAPQQVSFVV